MQKNKILDDYLDSTFNINFNSDIIHNKLNSTANKKKVLINMLAILIIATTIGTITNSIYAKRQWDEEYTEYQNRIIKSQEIALQSKIDTKLTSIIDMDYLYNDNIGIRINSIFLTNDFCQMDISIIGEENASAFDFGIAVYDELNNIYCVRERTHYNEAGWNYEKKLCKELDIKYNPKKLLPEILSTDTKLQQESTENNCNNFCLKMQTYKGFPNSKKLYIRIFDIGYSLEVGYNNEKGEHIITESDNFPLSNYEWQFEIDIPENYYSNKIYDIKFENEIDGFKLEKGELSPTGLVIHFKHIYSQIEMDTNTIELMDENGKKYFSTGVSNNNTMQLLFFNQDMTPLDDELYIIINIPEHNINSKVKLIKK